MKKRLCIVFAVHAAILAAGLAYAYFITHSGARIPCFLLLFTGRPCATCGVSRMFLSMMRLDFTAAFRYNPVIFCLLPLGLLADLRLAFLYVQNGRIRMEWWIIPALALAIISLAAFGVVRFFF